MRYRTLLVLGVLLAAASSSAEVRLDSDRRGIDVRITSRGGCAWGVSGRADSRTLNALGALRGDGAPSVTVNGSRALAAWVPAGESRLAMSLGMEQWTTVSSIVNVAPEIAPQVVAWNDGWLIAWTDAITRKASLGFISAEGSLVSAAQLLAGDVQALVSLGPVFHLLLTDSAGSLQLLVVHVVPVPIGQPTIYRVIRVAQLSPGAVSPTTSHPGRLGVSRNIRLAENSPLVFRSGSSTTLLDPQWQGAQPSNTRSIALGGSLVGVVQLSETEAVAVWWRDSSTLEFVKLSDTEIGDVQQVSGRGNFSPSLVKEALRVATAE